MFYFEIDSYDISPTMLNLNKIGKYLKSDKNKLDPQKQIEFITKLEYHYDNFIISIYNIKGQKFLNMMLNLNLMIRQDGG